MTTVTALRKPKLTIGGLIDSMHDVREQRRVIAAKDKELSAEYDTIEASLIGLLESEDTDKGSGRKASASLSVKEAFNFVENTGFDQFMAYVAKTKRYDLVQRRFSAPGVSELFHTKGAVPGILPYMKKSINLRNL